VTPLSAERLKQGVDQTRRAAAVQAATLCKSVSRSRESPTLACRARARARRHAAQPQTRRSSTSRDAVRECKSELRAAHSRVQSKGKSWAPRHRVSLRLPWNERRNQRLILRPTTHIPRPTTTTAHDHDPQEPRPTTDNLVYDPRPKTDNRQRTTSSTTDDRRPHTTDDPRPTTHDPHDPRPRVRVNPRPRPTRPTTDDRRPRRRPATHDRQPTTDDRRPPTTHNPRPTHDPRPTTDPRPHDPRPTTHDQRPATTTHDPRPDDLVDDR